ncbi:MAG TPA: 50S ribosomal protein L11 methyltransferase [Thermoanaerobaculia bacterium]|nr:50S ribosomal protein L11 methyltransferase [Thermoanaerobaculia bacterium]
MVDYLLEISFDAADTALEELVQAALFRTASRGSSAEEANGTTTISAWFDSAAARGEAEAALRGLEVELDASERERIEWLERYEQSLHPIEIGERFVVAPDPSLFPPRSERLPIVVPQEQAFGTGSHETTALCMALLETLSLGGRRGLDIGSGSGILALAMLRLGVRKVVAFDSDPDAYAALRENRARNGVRDGEMPLFIGSIEALRGGTFDIMAMNIIPEVIVSLLGEVVPRMSDSAALIVSGVLVERREEVIEAARRHRLALRTGRERGEWWAGLFQRRR